MISTMIEPKSQSQIVPVAKRVAFSQNTEVSDYITLEIELAST